MPHVRFDVTLSGAGSSIQSGQPAGGSGHDGSGFHPGGGSHPGGGAGHPGAGLNLVGIATTPGPSSMQSSVLPLDQLIHLEIADRE